MVAQKKMFVMKMFVFLMVLLGITQLPAGSVLMSYWDNQATATLDDAIAVTQTLAPTGTEIFKTVDMPGTEKDNYVDQYTGYIVAPVTGNYTFYIASDNDAGFWLSNEPNMPNIVNTTATPPLCVLNGFVGYLDFTNRAEQQSGPVLLQAGQAYGFTVIHREAAGGDHVALGWKLPGEDDIEVIAAHYFTNEYKVGGPLPADGAEDVATGFVSWLAPATSSGTGTLTYAVYLDTDPNFVLPPAASGISETEFDAGAVNGINLDFETTYYWRVDVNDPNIGGTPATYIGDIWSFTTKDGNPVIVTHPDHVFGELNQGAVFTVVAETPRPGETLSYQWAFKTFDASEWTDIPGATEASLSLSGLQPGDRGMYRVTVSDTLGNFVQTEANLYLQVGLLHRYSFTDSVADSVGGMHGTLVVQNPGTYPAVYEDATGTSGDPAKRQLYLQNGPSTPTSGGGQLCYVSLPSGLASSIGKQMTVMVWFTWRATTDQNWQGILSFNDGTSNNYLTLTPRSDSRTPRFAYRSPAEQRFLFSPNPIPLSNRATTEYCFAITWNEDTGLTEMYVNGNLVSSNAVHFKLSEDLNDINNWLGRQVAGGDPAFWGAFNEFRVYDVALGAPTIKEAYQLGPDVLPGNPCVIQPLMDLNDDCVVDFNDFALLASDWLACGLTTCN
jgi:hypothetical protein